jgi:ethanolamine-phosphate phospho-lyase
MSCKLKRKVSLISDDVAGVEGIQQDMSRRLTKAVSTSSSCASNGSETDSDCTSPLTDLVHKSGLNLSKTHHYLTGSFLFDDSPLPALPNKPTSLMKPVNDRLINSHIKNQGPNVSMFYKADGGIIAVKGHGAVMYEPDGSSYLDCANNVAGCGHSHPLIVKAAVDEIQNIMTNGRFLHPLREKYVHRLLATLPPELDTIYFVNSGSEANDLALRMAKQYSTSPNPDHVICVDSAYHGHVQSVVDVSPYKWCQCTDGNAKRYHKEHVHVVSSPDTYRGPYKTGAEYASEIQQIIEHTGGVGAFIHESILGCGGQIMMPDGYLPIVYDIVRLSGGCVIADEVQTGFGRAGTSFWQFQHYGVTPDIVTMGKPMGNGYPIGAVACRREVADRFAASGIEYFNTYGGNSVACAVGNAVLDAIEQDGLQENARVVGEYLLNRLRTLMELPSVGGWVGDVRGHGLFQGVEFVKKRTDLIGNAIIPHEKLCRYVVDFLKYERIIVSRDGPDGNVIKIKPPLVFSEDNVDTLVNGMKRALIEAEKTGYF